MTQFCTSVVCPSRLRRGVSARDRDSCKRGDQRRNQSAERTGPPTTPETLSHLTASKGSNSCCREGCSQIDSTPLREQEPCHTAINSWIHPPSPMAAGLGPRPEGAPAPDRLDDLTRVEMLLW